MTSQSQDLIKWIYNPESLPAELQHFYHCNSLVLEKKRYLLNIYNSLCTKDNVQIPFLVSKYFSLIALDHFFWPQLHSSPPSILATQFPPPPLDTAHLCLPKILRELLRLHQSTVLSVLVSMHKAILLFVLSNQSRLDSKYLSFLYSSLFTDFNIVKPLVDLFPMLFVYFVSFYVQYGKVHIIL